VRSFVTGHAGGSIHEITLVTMVVPLAVLLACELRRLRPATACHPAGSLAVHVGEFAALVVPSLTIFFDAVNAGVLLGTLLAAAALLLAPQVRALRSAATRRAPCAADTVSTCTQLSSYPSLCVVLP
jgi:hypothetical protein